MTTSISSPESSALVTQEAKTRVVKPVGYVTYRIRHTLASRFAFLLLCVAIILSTLAYGTVHSWSLGVFYLGSLTIMVLWVIDSWMLGSVRVSRNVLQWPLAGMILLGLIQLLPLRNPGTASATAVPLVRSLSLSPYATRLVVIEVLALLIYFAGTLVFIDTPKRLRLLVRTITIFGFFLAIFGLTQSLTSPNKLYWIREQTQSQPFGPFINRHHFAGYMELALAVPLGLLFSGSLEKEKRFVYLFAASLMGVALIMTNSRGGMISLIAEILFLVVIMGARRDKRKGASKIMSRVKGVATKAGLALVLFVMVLAGVVLLGGGDVMTRLAGTVSAEDPTTGRAHFWSVTVDIIRSHPVIGTGLGAFAVVYTGYDSSNGLFRLEQVHNDYLQVLSDGGIVGAVIGLFFVINLFRLGFVRRESRDDFRRGVANGALAGCFAVLVHSFFDFTLHTTANALLFLVLAAMATMNGRVEDVQSRPRRRRRRTLEVGKSDSTAGKEMLQPAATQ